MKQISILTWAMSCLVLFPASLYAKTFDVTVGNNFFSPSNLTIEVGDTVRWTNSSGRTHDVTANDGSWASETSSSFVYERTFNSVEEVRYYCSVHSTPNGTAQNGVINVVEATTGENPMPAFSANCSDLDCNFVDESTDSDGTITAWAWEFGDDVTSTEQNPSHSYATAGTYAVKLTVTDNDGLTEDLEKNITVSVTPNQPPTASFISSCTNLDCNFTDQSADGDGTINSRSWNFGDGSTSAVINPSHSYSAAGTYSVELTVTDDDGAVDTETQSVTVTAVTPDTTLINSGMSDAWFDPTTDGQGFFIIVWENSNLMFLSWFTFDTERPAEDVTAIFGGPGQRWVTALGAYEGDTATLDVFLSTGGVLDSTEPPVVTDQTPIGTIIIQWTSCNAGTLTYSLASLGLSGSIPIERIVTDNVPACEAGQVGP